MHRIGEALRPIGERLHVVKPRTPLEEAMRSSGVSSARELPLTTRYSLIEPSFKEAKLQHGHPASIGEIGLGNFASMSNTLGIDVVAKLVDDGLLTGVIDPHKTAQKWYDEAQKAGWRKE